MSDLATIRKKVEAIKDMKLRSEVLAILGEEEIMCRRYPRADGWVDVPNERKGQRRGEIWTRRLSTIRRSGKERREL